MKYDKPFKTYDEQIEILQNKYGVVVQDREFARNILISISYNDLISGLKNILKILFQRKKLISQMIII